MIPQIYVFVKGKRQFWHRRVKKIRTMSENASELPAERFQPNTSGGAQIIRAGTQKYRAYQIPRRATTDRPYGIPGIRFTCSPMVYAAIARRYTENPVRLFAHDVCGNRTAVYRKSRSPVYSFFYNTKNAPAVCDRSIFHLYYITISCRIPRGCR